MLEVKRHHNWGDGSVCVSVCEGQMRGQAFATVGRSSFPPGLRSSRVGYMLQQKAEADSLAEMWSGSEY